MLENLNYLFLCVKTCKFLRMYEKFINFCSSYHFQLKFVYAKRNCVYNHINLSTNRIIIPSKLLHKMCDIGQEKLTHENEFIADHYFHSHMLIATQNNILIHAKKIALHMFVVI